jgi:ABC-type uncharacterized transport system involved in gliding motility auxiliary subunit
VRPWLPFTSFAGIVLFLFGLISYAMTRTFDAWTAIHVAGGGALLVASLVLNFAGFRRTVKERGTREVAQAAGGTLLFAAILVSVNVLAVRHPWRYDATESKIHTLSDQSVAIVRNLDQPVELLAFFESGDPSRGQIAEILDRYAAEAGKLTWRFVDPVKEPELATQAGVRERNVLVARVGPTTAQTAGDPNAGITEGAVTNLLLKVTRPGPKVIYVLSGHGEPALEDRQSAGGLAGLGEALQAENFEVRPLLLSTAPKVPDDAALVLVAGPKKQLLPHEVDELRAYLSRGGRVLLMLDPGIEAGLGPMLADYRVLVGDDMIVDQEEVPFFGARLGVDPLVEDFPPHPITKDFKERVVLLQARSVDAGEIGGDPGVGAQVIARTRPASWAEKDYVAMLSTGRVSKDAADREGPIPVAVAAGAGDDGARLVVVGDSDLATNENLGAFFNREFLLNAAQWLTGNEELIAERPRGLRPSRIDMTEGDFANLFRLGVLLLPEALLIVGLGVWWRRRSL